VSDNNLLTWRPHSRAAVCKSSGDNSGDNAHSTCCYVLHATPPVLTPPHQDPQNTRQQPTWSREEDEDDDPTAAAVPAPVATAVRAARRALSAALRRLTGGEARAVLEAAQLGASVLFILLYVWSTYVPEAPGSWRYWLDLGLCAFFFADYVYRITVRWPGWAGDQAGVRSGLGQVTRCAQGWECRLVARASIDTCLTNDPSWATSSTGLYSSSTDDVLAGPPLQRPRSQHSPSPHADLPAGRQRWPPPPARRPAPPQPD
jgi:hypothetical protein